MLISIPICLDIDPEEAEETGAPAEGRASINPEFIMAVETIDKDTCMVLMAPTYKYELGVEYYVPMSRLKFEKYINKKQLTYLLQ